MVEPDFLYTFAHFKRPPLGGRILCTMATVTLQLINLLLYPRNRQRRFQGYIIAKPRASPLGDLKVQRYNGRCPFIL